MTTKFTKFNKSFHYFASSTRGWNVGDKIHEVLEKRRKEDLSGNIKATKFSVYFVPYSMRVRYDISGYAPMIEGAKLIIREDY